MPRDDGKTGNGGKTGFELVLWKPPAGPEGRSLLREMVRDWYVQRELDRIWRAYVEALYRRGW